MVAPMPVGVMAAVPRRRSRVGHAPIRRRPLLGAASLGGRILRSLCRGRPCAGFPSHRPQWGCTSGFATHKRKPWPRVITGSTAVARQCHLAAPGVAVQGIEAHREPLPGAQAQWTLRLLTRERSPLAGSVRGHARPRVPWMFPGPACCPHRPVCCFSDARGCDL